MKKLSNREIVDYTLGFLENHKEQAIARLFPNASNDYKDEWRRRGVHAFWCHLDASGQQRVIDFAIETYAG